MADLPPSDEANRETLKRDSSPAPDGLEPGLSIGRFRLQSVLGRGGMGEVWKAKDPELGRTVAIKFLLGISVEDQKRFLKEAQVVAGLGHPSIAPVHEVGTHAGRSFIVMQYLDGTTLDRARMSFDETLKLVRDAAAVLDHAHQRGVIHRDIKPTNLMVAGGQVYVMDFGLARQTEARSSVSLSGTVVGTPAYMSPEQARGDTKLLDARTDVYSLGATLYELLTAQMPFPGNDLYAVLEKVVSQEPVPPRRHNPRIPAEVETIIRKAMDKDRDRRYATAAALAEDLDRFLAGKPILARPTSPVYRLKKHIRRYPVAWSTASAAFLIAVVAGAIFVSGRVRHQEQQLAHLRDLGIKAERYREAAELSRRASSCARDAKALYLIRTSTREQWEKLFDEAFRLANAAVEKSPDLAGSYYTLGEIREARHRWGEAIEAYDRTLELDPNHAEALYHRCLSRLEIYMEIYGGTIRIDRFSTARESPQSRRARGDVYRKGALEDLDRYKALAGKARDLRYAQGAVALADRDHPTAERIADELLKESRTDELVWFLKARSVGADKRYAEAIAIYDRLIADVMPQFGRAWHARALNKNRAGDVRGARDDFAKAVELDPSSYRGHFGLARMELDLGRPAEALRSFNAGINLVKDPEPLAIHGRARAREATGDVEGALRDYEVVLAKDPGAISVHYDRGRVRLAKGDRAGAIEDFTRSVESIPKFERRELTSLLEYWSKEIDKDEKDAFARLVRGLVRRDRGDAVAAVDDLSKAVAINPLFAPAFRHRGGLRYAQGDPSGAMEDFNRAIEIHPGYAEAYSDRSWRRRAAGDVDGSIADCDRAIEIDPRHSDAYSNRAIARRLKGDLDGTLSDATKALAHNPKNFWAAQERGLAREARSLLQEAAQDLEQALTDAPRNWANRAACAEALARVRAALEKK